MIPSPQTVISSVAITVGLVGCRFTVCRYGNKAPVWPRGSAQPVALSRNAPASNQQQIHHEKKMCAHKLDVGSYRVAAETRWHQLWQIQTDTKKEKSFKMSVLSFSFQVISSHFRYISRHPAASCQEISK